MQTYVNWDKEGVVELQDGMSPNGPVVIVTMSRGTNNNTKIQQFIFPADKRTEIEVALAQWSFVALA